MTFGGDTHPWRKNDMTHLNPSLKKTALAVLALSFCLLADAHAQKRQAVVIMRSPGGAAIAQCDGTMELSYHIVSEARLNNKEEVRMAGNLGASDDPAAVSPGADAQAQEAELRAPFARQSGADGALLASPRP